MIVLELAELINKKNNNKNEQKIQLSMAINFMCITDREKTRTFYANSDNEEIRYSDDANNKINPHMHKLGSPGPTHYIFGD